MIVLLDILGASKWTHDSELIFLSNYEGLTISYYNYEENTFWLIMCSNIVSYKITNEEFSTQGYLFNIPTEGAFFEILDSPWMKEFDERELLNKCKHCVYCFCDHTVEVIAEKFVYKQLKQKPIIKYDREIIKKDINQL